MYSKYKVIIFTLTNQLNLSTMKKVKTTTRNVKQTVRKFNDDQRREILNQIDNRPSYVSKSEMFKRFGMGHGGSIYYLWKKRLEMKNKPNPSGNVRTSVPMNVKSTKKLHTVTLRVEVGSIMELINLTNELVKVSKNKSVLSSVSVE